jgi:hypothetical protein
MKGLKAFLEISATSISLASIIFMGIVFYTESILGKGMLYIEPNRPLAFTELLICAFGGGLVIGKFLRSLRPTEPTPSKSYIESVGEEA